MQKKHVFIVLGVLVLLLVAVVVLLHPTPRYYITGVTKHESSYAGRPTSYWVDMIVANTPDQTNFFLDDIYGWIGIASDRPRWTMLAAGDPQALPVLRELLQSKQPQVRDMAARTLQSFAYTASTKKTEISQWKEIVAEVLALQKEGLLKNPVVIELCGEIGPDAKEAVPLLETTVRNGKERLGTRVQYAAALSRIDPSNESAIDVLVNAVQSQDDRASSRAISALWQYVQSHATESDALVKPHYADVKKGIVSYLERQDDDDPTVNLEPAKQLLRHIDPAAAKGKGSAN
jgi:HEAT repeat protein